MYISSSCLGLADPLLTQQAFPVLSVEISKRGGSEGIDGEKPVSLLELTARVHIFKPANGSASHRLNGRCAARPYARIHVC